MTFLFRGHTGHSCKIDHSCEVANLQKTLKFLAGNLSIHSQSTPHFRLLADSILISGSFDTAILLCQSSSMLRVSCHLFQVEEAEPALQSAKKVLQEASVELETLGGGKVLMGCI